MEKFHCKNLKWKIYARSGKVLVLTANAIPTALQAVKRQALCILGQPITVRISSPGTRPRASNPLAYSSACKAKKGKKI